MDTKKYNEMEQKIERRREAQTRRDFYHQLGREREAVAAGRRVGKNASGKTAVSLSALAKFREANVQKFMGKLAATKKRAPTYYILDGDMIYQEVQADSITAATDHIITNLAHHNQPYFVVDTAAHVLCLVYMGEVWR